MKIRQIIPCVATAVAVIVALTGCGNREGWKISGVIENAADSTLYIEEPSGPAWVLVDSIKVGKDGSFSYTASEAYGNGQGVFRLRMGDRSVYFPIEGSESLTLTAKAADMEKKHRLSGTAAANGFNTVDSLVTAAVNRVGADKAVNDSTLIAQMGSVILNDTTCIVSYYAIMHPIEDKMFFTGDNSTKIGLLGAAATRYATLRPNDARAEELRVMHQQAKQNKRNPNAKGKAMNAVVSGRPKVDFVRKDETGKDRDLNAVLDRGGVTVVNMTRFDHPESSANTATLGEVYKKYKDAGLEIYQISFDPNEAFWRQNAHNMPWISVYNRASDPTDILVAYNANPNEGPINFVFNRSGELIGRVTDPAELAAAVAKAF